MHGAVRGQNRGTDFTTEMMECFLEKMIID
jgi:hypothetical protein